MSQSYDPSAGRFKPIGVGFTQPFIHILIPFPATAIKYCRPATLESMSIKFFCSELILVVVFFFKKKSDSVGSFDVLLVNQFAYCSHQVLTAAFSWKIIKLL
ncbi:hypothetical protein BJV82DRAFT_606819, partial [Fennellomyces sp. T-0311]